MISYIGVLQSYVLIQFSMFLVLQNVSYFTSFATFCQSLNNGYCAAGLNDWLAIKLCMHTCMKTRKCVHLFCFVLIDL